MTVRRRLVRLLGRVGLDVERLDGADSLVLQRRGDHPHTVRRVGPPMLRSFVVYDRRAARSHMGQYQQAMAEHLGEEHLIWAFRELRINCVLDVGANQGQFARRLRAAGYAGRIVSYEPVAAPYAQLMAAAADDPGWFVNPWALGDEEGDMDIHVVPGTMSSLLPASAFGRTWSSRLRGGTTETVRVRRLDAVLDEATDGLEDPRVFLKMDTQGYDLATVRGAGDRLGEMLGLQSEVSCLPIYDGMPSMAEQLAAYESEGFAISAMFPVTYHRPTLRVIEFDVVMIRPEAARGWEQDRDGSGVLPTPG